MKNVLSYLSIILLFTLTCMSFRVNAQPDITCGEGDCSIPPTIDIDFKSGGESFTSFELTPRAADTTIEVGVGERPEDIRASMSQKNLFQNNITINSSGQEAANAGNVMLVSDLINDLNLILDGQSGQKGLDSIDLCGQNFLSGAYGVDARDWFVARRVVNTELDDRCDVTDVEWINTNKFICPSGFSESPNPNVDVTRYQARRKCQGVLQETRCVKRSLEVTCNFNKQQFKSCCDTEVYNWLTIQRDGNLTPPPSLSVCDPDNCNRIGLSDWFESGHVASVVYRVWEHELQSMTPELLCTTYRDRERPDVRYLDVLGNEVDYVEAEYIPSLSHNNFRIPWPDVVNFPKQASPEVFDIDNARVKIFSSESEISVSNCFGLDGSAYNDNECLRATLGPASVNGLFIAFMDSEGALSNKIRVVVPQGRLATQYAYVHSGGNGWVGCWEQHQRGGNMWTEIPYTTGNLSWGSYEAGVINPTMTGNNNFNRIQNMTGMSTMDLFNYFSRELNGSHTDGTIDGLPASCSIGILPMQRVQDCTDDDCGPYYYREAAKVRRGSFRNDTSRYMFPVRRRMNGFSGKHLMNPGESYLPLYLRCHNSSGTETGLKNFVLIGWHEDFPTNAPIDRVYYGVTGVGTNNQKSYQEVIGGQIGATVSYPGVETIKHQTCSSFTRTAYIRD